MTMMRLRNVWHAISKSGQIDKARHAIALAEDQLVKVTGDDATRPATCKRQLLDPWHSRCRRNLTLIAVIFMKHALPRKDDTISGI